MWWGTADGLCFRLASGANLVDADVVFVWFDDLVEAMEQGDVFFFVEETFEEAVLSPFAEAAEGFVDFGATFVVRDVVGDEIEGGHFGFTISGR